MFVLARIFRVRSWVLLPWRLPLATLYAALSRGLLWALRWAFPVAPLMSYAIDKLIGPRADTLGAQRGLDFTEHSKTGCFELQTAVAHEKGG